jgi:hypothetical protein
MIEPMGSSIVQRLCMQELDSYDGLTCVSLSCACSAQLNPYTHWKLHALNMLIQRVLHPVCIKASNATSTKADAGHTAHGGHCNAKRIRIKKM